MAMRFKGAHFPREIILMGVRCGLGHITVDTCGNLQFHIFLLASLIFKDLQEASFILPHEVSSVEPFIFRYL
jgi:hypothetical protein